MRMLKVRRSDVEQFGGNTAVVLADLRANGPATQKVHARRTGLSSDQVFRAMKKIR